MRWLKLWAALAGVFFAGRLVIAWAVPGSAPIDASFWTRLAVVPVLQTAAAGWALSVLRRRSGRS